jgi:hypothetical protein
MLPPVHSIYIVLLDLVTLTTFDGSTNIAASHYAVLRSLVISTSCLLGPNMQPCTSLADSLSACSSLFLTFVILFARYNIKSYKLSSTRLVSVIAFIWQFVSTSEGNIKPGDTK